MRGRMERRKLENILKNIHESLKWIWQIIMGFSLVSAVKSYSDIINNSSGSWNITFLNLSSALFLLTFIRFLVTSQ
jgi:hypothetical protein